MTLLLPTPVDGPPDRGLATPQLEPMLSHWNGVYQHVFVAFHPVLSSVDRKPAKMDRLMTSGWAQSIGWLETGKAVETTSFAAFAMGLMLASYGMQTSTHHRRLGVTDELIQRIRAHVEANALAFPWDDSIDPSHQSAIAAMFSALGVAKVQAWDEWREEYLDIELTAFGDWHGVPASYRPCAIVDKQRQMLFDCSFNSMDHLWTAIALTDADHAIVKPEDYFEGFYADTRTTPNWVNEPETYAAPEGW